VRRLRSPASGLGRRVGEWGMQDLSLVLLKRVHRLVHMTRESLDSLGIVGLDSGLEGLSSNA